jgi:hypothetical protein
MIGPRCRGSAPSKNTAPARTEDRTVTSGDAETLLSRNRAPEDRLPGDDTPIGKEIDRLWLAIDSLDERVARLEEILIQREAEHA